MADDARNDAPAIDTPPSSRPPERPNGRIGRFAAFAGLVGCAVLGVLLHRGHQREADLRSALSTSEYERVAAESGLEQVRAALQTMTADCEKERRRLDSTRAALQRAETERTAARNEISECSEALDQVTEIARSHRDKLDEIASAIRIGMIGVADIPSEGFIGGVAFDFEGEYRKVVRRYNDLVDRFNAAVERSNDLGEILNRVIGILRR